ncbi:MFS transporter [Parendozoicomonas haliclonae]|uniref:MFS transporter n=1 Tax=Parendozoicomonas haliclonae TaxID=1960125 RepID=UPI0013FE4E3B|nr:MFS transporter [Parendozoicomonas haliclonae]
MLQEQQADNQPGTLKLIGICMLGCMLETYDFMIYALMAPYISAVFFPEESQIHGLMLTFATFSIGYLSRPLGGFVFGHVGDRKGRKKPFSFTILLMAFSTACIGFLPGYGSIGLTAPFILLILRLAQGLSMGGEVGGALTYIHEAVPDKKTTACSAIACGMILGLALGHAIHAVLEASFDQDTMLTIGWRTAFWIGGLLGILGFIIRKSFQETAGFLQLQEQQRIHRIPAAHLFKSYLPQTLTATLAIMAHGFCAILFLVFIPTWLVRQGEQQSVELQAFLSAIASTIAGFCCILAGLMVDRWQTRFAIPTYLLIGLLSIPMTSFILTGPTIEAHCALQMGSILTGMACASSLWIFNQQFPADVRYTGSGITYNLGFALSGGLTPVLGTILASSFDFEGAIGLILVASAICGIGALVLNRLNKSM